MVQPFVTDRAPLLNIVRMLSIFVVCGVIRCWLLSAMGWFVWKHFDSISMTSVASEEICQKQVQAYPNVNC